MREGKAWLVACLGAGVVLLAARPIPKADAANPVYDETRVEHGRYLVEHVAMCVECHTPRAADGTLLREKLLHGAPVPVRSPYRNRPWALSAPSIAGMNGYTDEEGVRLLTLGTARTGKPLEPPMPSFRMTEEDARSVVAYLRSVP